MMSSGANYLGLYGQSPRHAAALYTDARDSLRQASSTSAAARRRSMQPPSPASSTRSYDTLYEEPRRTSTAPNTNTHTPPPPYSCRASILPETLPAAISVGSYSQEQDSRPGSSNTTSNSPPQTSRAQKRRSSVMIRDIGMRIFHAKSS
ncbi:hypothetical protein RHS04_08448 [Rhizoctonia solani]|uniref:Uncharacterized protein n=1 Tax=Rhizoctonia solani TaxID=456999 RepID=A0A8H7H255_9AGAM|nr:hypothetical protein RHS04_08448 [Rhizoctonia solani]